MSDLSIAHRIFDLREPKSKWHSETDKQEWIDRKAQLLAADIRERITTDVNLAEEIGALALIELSESETDAAAIAMLRHRPGREEQAGILIDAALQGAILKTAGTQAAELAENGPDQD